jgi:hypothetical protein
MPELKDDSAIFLHTIDRNLRHQDYDRVIALAKEYTTFVTGEGIKDMLRQFNGRETEDMFKQRINITIVNTADITNSISKPFYKVGRTPATISLTWSGKDAKQTSENKKVMEDVSGSFWGQKSLQDYLNKRQADYDKRDPNAWYAIEFQEKATPQNGVKVKPYPFEISSEEAVNFFIVDNITQWLIVRNDLLIQDDKGNWVAGEVLYSYFENVNLKATQIHEKVIQQYKLANPGFIEIDLEGFDLSKLVEGPIYIFKTGGKNQTKEARYYSISVYQHNIGMVPALRFGTITDPVTQDRTCVPMIEPAKCYLEQSIQSMSEMSLTLKLHTFPQKFAYLPKCEGEPKKQCLAGHTPEGGICKVCNGSGTMAHTSSQDLIGIRMPDDLKDVVNLEFMAVYKAPPIDLLKFQKEFAFDELKKHGALAVFGNGLFGLKQVVKTATEVEVDHDAVNDTLKPFGDRYSEMYTYTMKCIAKLRNMQDGFECTHQFPNDFAMESLEILLDNLTKANSSGAPSHVKDAINDKITKKIYADQPRAILKIETKNKFDPFAGKTEAEINFILASDLTTQYNKVLYANFHNIFKELEFDFGVKNIDFYELNEAVQRIAVTGKVTAIIAQLGAAAANDAAAAFGEDTQNNPEQIEEQAKATLRGTIAGIQGVIEIQSSVSTGITGYEAAITLLTEIYGFDDAMARKILGKPKAQPAKVTPAIPVLN